ncbi:MAG: acyl-CoA dehydrogenase [Ardenticatenaceae bacterium]|nr:MAG: acyl-CoA dehydrogenase [Ardenticatenaceae bacterium]
MTEPITGQFFLERMTPAELERGQRVESILPGLREHAAESDRHGAFHRPHKSLLREAGLLGLVVPEAYGGLGGTLRDLSAATFAMGTACPSTALAYFFHCSSVSRGLLALEAVEAGKFSADEAPVVRAFGEKVLHKMGTEGKLLGNFASESAKSSQSAVFISSEATKTEGGWLLNGTKSFGCNTGVADEYLVAAKLSGYETAEGLAMFFVKQDAPGVTERDKWDSLGMRATASQGIVMENVFVPDEDALAIPGAFVTLLQMSRGSLLGNQLAISAIYLGAAKQAYDYALNYTTKLTFKDSGKPIASSPFHQELIGKMTVDLETARLWLLRQLDLEISEPPPLPKPLVIRQWRMCKGVAAECVLNVAQGALKMCGTSNTVNGGVIARMLRDISMGLVMAFPPERGRLEAAKMVVEGHGQDVFSV